MFAEDLSAERPLGAFLGDSENRWRAGLRRFRRGGPRVAAGLTLIGRGFIDLWAGAPAVVVVGAALLLLWLARRMSILRLGLDWLVRSHGSLLAMLRTGARAAARAAAQIALGLATAVLVVALTPLLAQIVAWLETLDLPRFPDLPQPLPFPDIPTIPEVDWNWAGRAAGVFLDRALTALGLVLGAAALVLALAVIAAYAAFATYALVCAVAAVVTWVVVGVWRIIIAVAQATAIFLQAIGLAFLWMARALLTALWRIVRLPWRTARGFVIALAWCVTGLRRLLVAVGGAAAKGAAGLAAAGVGLWAGVVRSVVALFAALAGLAAPARTAATTGHSATDSATDKGALRAAAAAGSWLARLLRALARGLARGVWDNVFRLFALTGSIAAVTFTIWAWRSMQRGEPLPHAFAQLLAQLWASAASVTATLLASLSVVGILTAIAFAFRGLSRRIVRAAALSALILLVLACMPFALRALWTSPPAVAIREALPELLAKAAEAAPVAAVSLIAALSVGLIFSVMVWTARIWWGEMAGALGKAVAPVVAGRTGAAATAPASTSRSGSGGVVWLALVLGVVSLLAAGGGLGREVAISLFLTLAAIVAFLAVLWFVAATAAIWRAVLPWAAGFALAALVVFGGVRLWPAIEQLSSRIEWPDWTPGPRADSETRSEPEQRRQRRAEAAEAPEKHPAIPTAPRRERQSWASAGWKWLAHRWAQIPVLLHLTAPPALPEPDARDESRQAPGSEAGADESAPRAEERQADTDRPDEQAPEEPAPAPAPLVARVIFPDADGAPLHWRFASAGLVGDGLSAFLPVDQAAKKLDVCGAGAIVAVGAASHDGDPAFNACLAQRRADGLASAAEAALRACQDAPAADGASARVYTLSLGGATATADDPRSQRPVLVLRLDDARPLDGTAEAELARTPDLARMLEEHVGAWTLADRTAPAQGKGDAEDACGSTLAAR